MVACLVAAAVFVAGCGSDDGGAGIPADQADEMKSLAAEIDAATAAQECDVAQASTTELRASVEALPGETDPEIVDALNAMVTRIDDQLEEECTDTGTSDETSTTETETTEVAPTTSVPEETTTTTTTTPPEEEEPETPEQPPGEGGGPNGPPATPPGQGGAPPSGGIEEDE